MLAVGSIRDKVLAARRHGIVQVILPKQNESRVEDEFGEDLRREIGVQYVSTIDEALDLVLFVTGVSPASNRDEPSPEGLAWKIREDRYSTSDTA